MFNVYTQLRYDIIIEKTKETLKNRQKSRLNGFILLTLPLDVYKRQAVFDVLNRIKEGRQVVAMVCLLYTSNHRHAGKPSR